MPESLLSTSEVLLFGRKLDDLQVLGGDFRANVVATRRVQNLRGHIKIDKVRVGEDDVVLVTANGAADNGRYTVGASNANWTKIATAVPEEGTVYVDEGNKNKGSLWRQTTDTVGEQEFERVRDGGRLGSNNFVDLQLADDACFARIYGFSYEGAYFDLPSPTLFLVHGEGMNATEFQGTRNSPPNLASRAPNEPSLSGVGSADFQIANDIVVWSYDKSDFTIRMDVMTGMLEHVLLNVFFEHDAPALAGGRVSGGRVSGGRVSGGRVSGGRVSGGRVSGGRVSGSGD